MPTSHRAVLAFPITAQADQTQARNLCVTGLPYVVSVPVDVLDLVAVDPNTGVTIQVIISAGRVFRFDPLDNTSAHDGLTVLVSYDGKRYKLSDQNQIVTYSVINVTTTAPPATSPAPAIGDAYLVATGGTGVWSGHDHDIAINTVRGWEFSEVLVGQFVYDESTDSYWHKKADNSLALGFGMQALGANTVPISAVVGSPFRFIVENQTTNAPPGSPSPGVAYVIGPSPTGAWSGNAGKIAICEVSGSFTIYTPRDGELVYDKALKADYRYDSGATAWIPQAGALVFADSTFTTSGTTSTGGSGGYTYSPITAPTTALNFLRDDVTITRAARRVGARLRFQYQFHAGSGIGLAAAIFKDSDANATDWANLTNVGNTSFFLVALEAIAADTSSHTWTMRLINNGGGTPAAPTRRRFGIQEYS